MIQSSQYVKSIIALQWFMPSRDDISVRSLMKVMRSAIATEDKLIFRLLNKGASIQYTN